MQRFLLCVFTLALFTSCSPKLKDKSDQSLLSFPENPKNQEHAPKYFKVLFKCTNGEFIVESRREWSPNGVDRFYNLAKNGYYDGSAFFRVIPNFIVQFGIHPNVEINAAWDDAMIQDDPTIRSNTRGTLSYGTRGENSRTTHLIINYEDNSKHLDPKNPVVAEVILGMDVVDSIFSGYGDLPQFGGGAPDPQKMNAEGYDFLATEFPKLDYIVSTAIISEH